MAQIKKGSIVALGHKVQYKIVSLLKARVKGYGWRLSMKHGSHGWMGMTDVRSSTMSQAKLKAYAADYLGYYL